MYMVFKDKCKPPTTENIKLAYVKSLDNLTAIKRETDKISKLLDACYNPNIMGHNVVTSKLNITMHYLIAKLVHSVFSDKDYKLTDTDQLYVRNAIKETNKDIEKEMSNINTKKKNIKTSEEIYKLLNSYYEGLVSGDHCITEESENDDDNDISSDNDEDEKIAKIKDKLIDEDNQDNGDSESTEEMKKIEKLLKATKPVKKIVPVKRVVNKAKK